MLSQNQTLVSVKMSEREIGSEDSGEEGSEDLSEGLSSGLMSSVSGCETF